MTVSCYFFFFSSFLPPDFSLQSSFIPCDISNALLNVHLFIAKQDGKEKKLNKANGPIREKEPSGWKIVRDEWMLLTNSLLFYLSLCSSINIFFSEGIAIFFYSCTRGWVIAHRQKKRGKKKQGFVLWILCCWTIMLNPQCETNKFSLHHFFFPFFVRPMDT